MYDNPPTSIAIAGGTKVPEDSLKECQRHFEDFYEEVFIELSKFGEMEELIVCDNIGDHLIGNVYVKYATEEGAENCIKGLTGRYYAGKVIIPEYSPVTDFREARCRQYDEGECKRGGFCNFMHLKHISRSFKRSLFRQMYEEHPEYKKRIKKDDEERKRSRSKGKGKPKRSRSRSKDKHKQQQKPKKSRSRSKSRDKKRKSKSKTRSKSKSASPDGKRQTSEERRAMIEMWNQEEEARSKNPAQA